MTSGSIRATVAILTKDSERTLDRALRSVSGFAEILVCDGGSTDKTRAIAAEAGARVLTQDPRFLDENGRIRDFGGVRNQTLAAATNDWFLFLDSDEYLSDELLEEIRATVTSHVPAAFWVPRIYVHKGERIDCASTYPNPQMRLFNRTIADTFIKEVHERIVLTAGAPVETLTSPMMIPIPDEARTLVKKWKGYLSIEVSRHSRLSLRVWFGIAGRNLAAAVLYALRTIRIFFFCRGRKMPLSFELARIRYQIALVLRLFRTIRTL